MYRSAVKKPKATPSGGELMNRDEKYTVIVRCGQLGASLTNAISDVGGTRGVQRIWALYLCGVGGYSGYWEEWEAAILSIK